MLAANLPPALGSACIQGGFNRIVCSSTTIARIRLGWRLALERLYGMNSAVLPMGGGGDHQQIVRLFHRITPVIDQRVNEARNLEARARTCKPTHRLALTQKWSAGYLWRTHNFDP